MVNEQEEVALTGEPTTGNGDVGEFGPGAVDALGDLIDLTTDHDDAQRESPPTS